MLRAQSIDEVISQLDYIISWSRKNRSRIGYFATLYRRMTIGVKEGIANSSFRDAARMELLDVNFANRYLQAWECYVNKKPCSRSWQKVFDACNTSSLAVIQHLILGVNTHINLDLGIAAAETSPGEKIYDLQTDFEKVNDIIASLTEAVQETLCKVWFPLRAIGKISGHRENAVINFSITTARKAAWANAQALCIVDGTARENYIGIIDDSVVRITDRIINPGLAMKFLLRPVIMMESKNIESIIDLLK
jgi:hypothetical protein